MYQVITFEDVLVIKTSSYNEALEVLKNTSNSTLFNGEEPLDTNPPYEFDWFS